MMLFNTENVYHMKNLLYLNNRKDLYSNYRIVEGIVELLLLYEIEIAF